MNKDNQPAKVTIFILVPLFGTRNSVQLIVLYSLSCTLTLCPYFLTAFDCTVRKLFFCESYRIFTVLSTVIYLFFI